MLEAYKVTHLHQGDKPLEVVLTFDERKKSRHRTHTQCGQALGWFIERGMVLSHGQVLACNDGTLVKVLAAKEWVSKVTTDDALLMTRAAYHLGNRHVPLQVASDFLSYQRDHVLDEMVVGLGLTVNHTEQVFEPENGAYAGGHHHHHESEAC